MYKSSIGGVLVIALFLLSACSGSYPRQRIDAGNTGLYDGSNMHDGGH
jgi:outer membrane biogenesis lipoprotein LolB